MSSALPNRKVNPHSQQRFALDLRVASSLSLVLIIAVSGGAGM
jgi:hypothetical protein